MTLDLLARRSAAALAGAALLLPLVVSTPAHAQTQVSFDFESGVAGWQAPSWLESNAGTVAQSTDQAVSGTHSLALPVVYEAGSGWEQSGAVYRLDQPFSASGAASFRVYAPIGGLSARFQFNDPWTEPIGLRSLNPGWNEVVYQIASDFPAPVNRVNEIILFVVGQNLPETFTGNVYFDDVAFTAGEPSDPEPPSGDIGFDFENGVAGWTAPDWLGSNAGAPFQDTAQVHGGIYSLGLPVRYAAASGWEQSGAVYRFPNAPVDISGYVAATFHVYAPVAGLSARFQFNDPWTEPASGLRPLQPGWNQVTYEIGPASRDFPGIRQANEIILFVVAQNLPETFEGTVWFDDVAFVKAAQPVVFDFEDGVTGWFAPDWLAGNAGQPLQDGTHAASGSFSLAQPVRYPAATGFEQAGAVYRFPNAPVSLIGYEKVTFSVYAPVSGLSADLVFNDPWNPPVALRPLQPGWNELTFDITPSSPDWPGTGVPSVNEFIIRVVAQNLPATYEGPVWIDNIQFLPGTAPVLQLQAPRQDDTLAVPFGSTYQIEVQASAYGARQLTSVSWRSDGQRGELSQQGGVWVGDWDIWAEGEGVTELVVTATDSEGESSTVRATVLVRNSGLTVDITAPEFDQQLAGQVTVTAAVTEDERFDLSEVVVYGLENDFEIPMRPAGAGTWTATLDTTELDDGVESIAVEARDEQFAIRDLAHVVIRNRAQDWDFVDTRGARFSHDGDPFRYVGFNEYELFTPPEHFGRELERQLDETIFGELLAPGTPREWRDNVDRQLLEASRNGFTVLRTWAFNRNNEDAAFQRMVNGEIVFNEATFQRLDYIMDSARRHDIRVILTLDNYWPDYGGIGRAAQWLGLENKLQFFTDPAAIALYQAYAEHLVTRVNTVTGVRYSQDPTVFAWELMNEPRSWCVDDPTPEKRFCDPTGATLRTWLRDQARFINDLAPDQMVSAGGEAHGWVPTPDGGIQWGGPDEGNNNIPFYDMDLPEIDFFTFHPYPNASWLGLDKRQTEQLIVSLVRMGVERDKPVVMEEWGIDRTQPVYAADGTLVEPGSEAYLDERRDHYRTMIEACYVYGCAGSNVWMLADWSDRALNINLYRPGADAARDAELVALLRDWAERANTGRLPRPPQPACQVRYQATPPAFGLFVAELRVTNTSNATVDGWELGWWFEAGQQVLAAAGAEVSQDGALVTAAGDQRIRPGRSRTVVVLGTTGSSTNPAPEVFTLNGTVCGS